MSLNDWRSKPRKRITKTAVLPFGRICTKCQEFKDWDCYSKATTTKIGYLTKCKSCMQKIKLDYRSRSTRDRDYKRERRTLCIGQLLHFGTDEIYVVKDKQPRQGYKLQSLQTGYYKILDTNEGNTSYQKFYKIYDNNEKKETSYGRSNRNDDERETTAYQ